MRISDWSSDVCSSDLGEEPGRWASVARQFPEVASMSAKKPEATVAVDRLTGFYGPDLHDLCDAAEAAILHGGGFGWLSPPPRQAMEAYWQGVLLVPERDRKSTRLNSSH